MAESTIITRAQAQQWLRGAADSTIRNHFILAYLRKEGRMTFGMSGYSTNWVVQARQPIATTLSSGGGATYDQSQVHETLTLPWAGIKATDAIDKKVKLMNQGPTQIVDLMEQKMDTLMKTVSQAISKGFYSQNNSNDDELVGIRTPCIPHGSVAAGDIVAALATSATYGGKAVYHGAIGGSWSSDEATAPSSVLGNDWPYGSGTSDYDYLAPKLVNYSSSGWGTGSTEWRGNCELAMRRGLSWAKHLNGDTNSPDVYLLSTKLHDEFKDSLATRERLYPESYARSLGFPPGKLLEYNGAIVVSDYYCPAGYGYAINAQEMELISLTDDLMFFEGPTYDENTLSEKMLCGFFGNYRFNPKAIVEFGAYA